ncbi:MAG: hypothetical protein PHN44_00090 [Candidatus Marinimicrobia bacterium]|nr:hypothetical protein [Candidatus Neomarinimicrobiota bacterium]
MSEQLFTWEGLNYEGKPIKVKNLTFEETEVLEAQEKAYKDSVKQQQQQQQSDVAMAPVINAEINKYAKNKGLTQEDLDPGFKRARPSALQSMPTDMGDPVISGLDNIKSQREDTTRLESVLNNIPAPQRSPVSGIEVGTEQPRTQGRGSIMSMLESLPDEIAQRLITEYRYNPKEMTPSKLLTEIRKAQGEMKTIREAEAKSRLDSELDIKKQEKVNEGTARAQEVAGEYDLAKSELDNASREKIARIQAATDNAKIEAKNAYSERTTILKPPQQEHIISYQNALNSIDAVSNLFDPKFVGLIDSMKGDIKQKLGILGTNETAFRTAIANIQNITLKDRSGAAVTVPEFERFKKEVVRTQAQPKQFMATLQRMRDFTQNELSTSLDIYSRTKQDVSGFEDLKKPIQTYGDGYKATAQPVTHPEASEAEKWARSNPNDPRAAEILKRLGK